MKRLQLENPNYPFEDAKANTFYVQFSTLLAALEKKTLSANSITFLEGTVAALNAPEITGNSFKKMIRKKQLLVVRQIEKEDKIVPIHYYRNQWMLLGFTTFGLPIGIIFGMSIGNMGLFGIGLPIGLAIGSVIGNKMDKKAFSEGRQLPLELNY